jgi:predicted DNA-binding protein
MSKAKVAVLHGGLLARKGEARPLSTFGPPTGVYAAPQQLHREVRPEPVMHRQTPAANLDADASARQEPKVTGWHDDQPCASETRCQGRSAPILDLDALAARSKASAGKERTELHARLDNMSHKRLKIAAAQLGRSQQEIVATAIDAYLEYLEVDALNNCRCMQNARG